jgi:hypothetical protein
MKKSQIIFWDFFISDSSWIRTGKGSGKHLFSRRGRIGKTVGFPGVRFQPREQNWTKGFERVLLFL